MNRRNMSDGITNYAGSCERSKIAMKLAVFAGIEALFFTVLAFITGLGTGWSGLGPFTLSAVPFGIAALFSIAAIFYGMLSGNAAEEEYEKELLKKRKENHQSLLDVSEDVRFTSGRTFQNYLKYAPQVFAVLGFLIVLVSLWQATAKLETLGEAGLPLPKSPMSLAFVCAISAAVALFTGMFDTGFTGLGFYHQEILINLWCTLLSLDWIILIYLLTDKLTSKYLDIPVRWSKNITVIYVLHFVILAVIIQVLPRSFGIIGCIVIFLVLFAVVDFLAEKIQQRKVGAPGL